MDKVKCHVIWRTLQWPIIAFPYRVYYSTLPIRIKCLLAEHVKITYMNKE